MIKKIGDGILIFFVLIVVGLGLLGSIGTSGGGGGRDQIEPGQDNSSPFEEAVPPPWQATPPDLPPSYGGQVPDSGGRTLPPAGPYDDQSRVRAETTQKWTSGTGFAVGANGVWLTAKHVAIGCDRFAVLDQNQRMIAKAQIVYLADSADVAVFRTPGGPNPMAMDLDESDIKLGSQGFHVGYPQGKPGEVTSKLIGRELMVTEGAWQGRENTLSWAETGRTQGIIGTLGGLSGGPAFDERGNIIGITIAENPRRGRIVTTSSASIMTAIRESGIQPTGTPQSELGNRDFSTAARKLRGDLKVVQLVCQR